MTDSIAPDVLSIALETLALEEVAPDLLNTLTQQLNQAVAQTHNGILSLQYSANADDNAHLVAQQSQHGSLSLFAPAQSSPQPPQRLATFDRRGRLLLLMTWQADGTLVRCKVRGLDGHFLGIIPGASSHLGWGLSDCLWTLDDRDDENDELGFRPDRFLTLFRSVPYQDITALPPLDDPGRLPTGTGSTVLNVLSLLSQDQGKSALRYRGPYPSAQLFATLCESFHTGGESGASRERFTQGAEEAAVHLEMKEAALDWSPSPYERFFPAAHTCVQLRDGIEKVYDRGRVYYHPNLAVSAHALRTEHCHNGQVTYTASLVLLGQSIEDHLILDANGEILERPVPPQRWHVRAPAQLSADWKAVLVRLIAAESAAALHPELWPVVEEMPLTWGTVQGELWEEKRTEFVLHAGMIAVYRETVAAARSAGEALLLAARFTSELARLIGPLVRLRAQERLAQRSLEDQQVALFFNTPSDSGLSDDELRKFLSRLALGEDLPVVSV